MIATHSQDVQKAVKGYLFVLAVLMVLTVVTVGVSYLHLSVIPAVILALFIATIKGSLVACYFMHLISEQKVIYAILIFTIFNFIVLLLFPVLGFKGSLFGTVHVP